MRVGHFTDALIDAVLNGHPLSIEEREFLIRDTPTFEECNESQQELSVMSDAELMRAAYSVWADYASGL